MQVSVDVGFVGDSSGDDVCHLRHGFDVVLKGEPGGCVHELQYVVVVQSGRGMIGRNV